jgi:hypothetical protein
MFMRTVPLALAALLTTGVAAHAQDVRGVINNLNRALNPQQEEQQRNQDNSRDNSRERQQSSARYDDRDLDRLFRSEGARQLELDRLSQTDRRQYESATPNERRRWDDEFADNARQRWQRMSDSERRRYMDEVQQADRGGDRGMSGSSDSRRR